MKKKRESLEYVWFGIHLAVWIGGLIGIVIGFGELTLLTHRLLLIIIAISWVSQVCPNFEIIEEK